MLVRLLCGSQCFISSDGSITYRGRGRVDQINFMIFLFGRERAVRAISAVVVTTTCCGCTIEYIPLLLLLSVSSKRGHRNFSAGASSEWQFFVFCRVLVAVGVCVAKKGKHVVQQ